MNETGYGVQGIEEKVRIKLCAQSLQLRLGQRLLELNCLLLGIAVTAVVFDRSQDSEDRRVFDNVRYEFFVEVQRKPVAEAHVTFTEV